MKFLDQLDGSWNDVISDVYSENNGIKLLDAKELYINYDYINEDDEEYKVEVEYDLNTIDIFLDLNIKSDSDNIKINYYDENFLENIDKNYENLKHEDVISFLYVGVWQNQKGKYRYNLNYVPYKLTGLYKGQMNTDVLKYGTVLSTFTFNREKNYYMNPILLYKQIERFINKDLNTYIKEEDAENVIEVFEKVKVDIDQIFKEKNERYL